MKLQKSPSFRKPPAPWHDSDPFCLIISIFAAAVFYFSLAGMSVALENHAYQRHCWVPITLLLLSGILLTINLLRILNRMANRFAKEP
jgi:uncharacterized membrane protein